MSVCACKGGKRWPAREQETEERREGVGEREGSREGRILRMDIGQFPYVYLG